MAVSREEGRSLWLLFQDDGDVGHLADKMTDYRVKLRYPESAVGVAVTVGCEVGGVDVFNKAATCQKA